MATKKKYYVVWQGHRPGIYDNWTDAQAQITGFTKARYRGFPSRPEAEAAFRAGPSAAAKKNRTTGHAVPTSDSIIHNSLSVDAACSGNPGPMEYQGVDTRTGERIFHQAFSLGTNNIGEFLAIVHGLALLQKQGLHDLPIYTDSATAIKWVKNKKVKTLLERNARTEKLFQLIERGEVWLRDNPYRNPILKWQTEKWGEIPADFGRK